MFPLKDNIPTLRFPIVTVTFIALNVIAYFFWQQGGLSIGSPDSHHYFCNLVDNAVIPFEVANPGEQVAAQGCPPPETPTWLTLFTAMFMHGGLLHLGGNMLFLWIFGNNVEDSMGPLKFIVFYLLGGLAATALQVAIDPSSTVPTIGASGAIAGVLGGYIILFPRARVVTLIFIVFFVTLVEVPALGCSASGSCSRCCSARSTSARRARRAASRTLPTSGASRSGCWRSSCSPMTASNGARAR